MPWSIAAIAAVSAISTVQANKVEHPNRQKARKAQKYYEPIDFESMNTKEPKYAELKYGGSDD